MLPLSASPNPAYSHRTTRSAMALTSLGLSSGVLWPSTPFAASMASDPCRPRLAASSPSTPPPLPCMYAAASCPCSAVLPLRCLRPLPSRSGLGLILMLTCAGLEDMRRCWTALSTLAPQEGKDEWRDEADVDVEERPPACAARPTRAQKEYSLSQGPDLKSRRTPALLAPGKFRLSFPRGGSVSVCFSIAEKVRGPK